MKRWLVILAVALALALPIFAYGQTAAAPAASQLGVTVTDIATYPDVTLSVTVPAEMLAGSTATPSFTIAENGVPLEVKGIEAESANRVAQDVILVIDTSGSMRGDAIANAQAAARGFLDELSPEDRVALVSFAFQPKTVSSFTNDRAALVAAIDGLAASGETAMNDALVTAAALAERSNRQVTIVLLSDGGDTVSVNSFDNAVAAIKAAGTPVFAVALQSSEWDPARLQTLASTSGGRYLATANSAELTALYQGIAQELTSRYLVTVTSLGPNTMDLDLDVTATLGDKTASGSVVAENPLYGAIDPDAPAPVVAGQPAIWRSSLAVGLLGLAVVGFIAAIGLMFVKPKAALEQLEFYDQGVGDAGNGRSSSRSLQGKMVDAVGYVAGKSGFAKALHAKLEQAGMPLRPNEYIYMHVLGVIVLGILAAVLSQSFAVAMIVVLLAVVIPLALLENAIQKRRMKFEEQLPEVLNLLAGSLRAGWGLLQSVSLVVEQMGSPAAEEFRRVETEARLGLSVEEALENMAERLKSEDFRWTVTAISIQREVGGNLAEVLDIVANTMRERAEVRRHIRSLTAEGRLSGIVLMVLPFFELIVLSLANPGYMGTLFVHPFGWLLAIMGVVLLIIGGIWLRRAIAVEV